MAGLPQLQGTHPYAEQYSRALSSVYHSSWRIIDPSFALEQDIDIWEKIRRDPKVYQVIQKRTAATTGSSWDVTPASEDEKDQRLALVVKAGLERIKNFRQARRKLAEAIFLGTTWAFTEGERRLERLADDTTARRWWLPTRLRNMDKGRFEYQLIGKSPDLRPVLHYMPTGGKDKGRWIPVPSNARPALIKVEYDAEERALGYGRGLLDVLYYAFWMKSVALSEGLHGLKRWARGILVAKVDAEAHGLHPDDAADEMLDVLEKSRTEHYFAVDKRDDIINLSAGGQGHQIVMDIVNYLDNCISVAGLGSVLPFGGSSDVGSLARSETEQEESDELMTADREVQEESFDSTLIPLFIRQNSENIRALGLADAQQPRFTTVAQKKENPAENVNVIKIAREAGIDLIKSEVYEKINFTQPSDDDEVLPPMPAAAPAGGGFGGPPQQQEFDFGS